jgi:hypothetical protein
MNVSDDLSALSPTVEISRVLYISVPSEVRLVPCASYSLLYRHSTPKKNQRVSTKLLFPPNERKVRTVRFLFVGSAA